MEKRIVSSNGDIIQDTLVSQKCEKCILSCVPDGYKHITCPIDSAQKRIGYASSSKGAVAVCSSNAKTTKNFKQEVQNIVDCIPQLLSYRKEVEREVSRKHSSKIDMLVHNLKSQNAHAIQELYNFVTEEEFTRNINASVDIVKKRIEKRARLAAVLFLRLAKINSAMDDEIFIYENLIKTVTDYKLSVRPYNFRDVVMLVFHEFMEDYNKNSIFIDAEEYYERVRLDFRTTRFVLYHIIGNSSKYTKPNTNIKVSFDETNNHHIVKFEMISYYMTDEDVEHIYDEGYSGNQAKTKGTSGKGLGMYLVKQMMELNRIHLNILPGRQKIVFGGIEYANNVFEILIPKDY